MLAHIGIKNVALIEEAEIDFYEGLNILSGETGAGKSMVIDSINFVLGGRTSREFVRKGALQAVVEALFVTEIKEVNTILQEFGIETEEDGTVLVKRSLLPTGRTVNRVNGSTVTAGMLVRLSESLLDIHGQHEHQSLLNASKHIKILDRFCGEALEQKKAMLEKEYQTYRDTIKSIQALSGNERERAHKLDLLQFQKDEIEGAALFPGEEEALLEKKKRLLNLERMQRLLLESIGILSGEADEMPSAVDLAERTAANLRELTRLDSALSPVLETMESASALLDDAFRELSRYSGHMEAEEESLDDLENRLTEIYHLKRKYGNSVEEILEYLDHVVQEMDFIGRSEEEVARLTKEKLEIEKTMTAYCMEMTEIRKKKAEKIQKEIEAELWDLQMKNARFAVSFDQRKEFGPNGWDAVEFLISANVGEELRPLSKIASGGEMSRVMLAMKTVLSDADSIETFIFDEIDTGISGRTAQKVAEKMAAIGKKRQLICITHLPQIAAMADRHFLIEKQADQSKTTTYIKELTKKGRTDEIARLMGGTKITEATIAASEEMLFLANEFKADGQKKARNRAQ